MFGQIGHIVNSETWVQAGKQEHEAGEAEYEAGRAKLVIYFCPGKIRPAI